MMSKPMEADAWSEQVPAGWRLVEEALDEYWAAMAKREDR